MSGSREILVSVGHAEGTAGVWRDNGGDRWLSARLEGRGGTLLDEGGHSSIEGLGLDLTVQGGVLPPGAASAQVIDDAGHRHEATAASGVWVVVLEQRSHRPSPVHYLDDAGESVRPPLPAGWRVEPVSDARESCPVCSCLRWEKVTPTDAGARGAVELPGGGMEPSPVLVCAVCGHEEQMPTFIGLSTGGEDWEDVEGDVEPLLGRAGAAAAVSGVDFPVYSVAGWEPKLTGIGSVGAVVTDIDIAHGMPESERWLTVSTVRERAMDSGAAIAREALQLTLRTRDEPWPDDLSEAALTLWLRSRERELRQAAAAAPTERVALTVEGSPVEFELVRSGEDWAAAARLADDELGVTISARGVDPSGIALERIPDLAALAQTW
jgi:hypothetical protein